MLNLTGHKDESICRTFAERMCQACGKTVVCTGGFHLENITPQQIKEVLVAKEKLEKLLLEELR